MNPRIQTGKGISGCIRYARGQGRDAKTGLLKELAPGEKSRVEWFAGAGFGFEIANEADLELARRMMEFAALNQASRTKKCEQDCVHLSLSWSAGEKPSRAQMEAAAHSALAALGMADAMALFFAHDDEDYKHVHIVASKINPDTGRAYDLAGSWRTLSTWAEQYEREHGGIISTRRTTANELRAAIARRDAEGVLEALTKQRSTFTAEQLERALQKEIHLMPGATAGQKEANAQERTQFARTILAHASAVALADEKDGPITRYTTRAVLEAESYVLSAAEGLIADNRHELDGRQRFGALGNSRYEGISREQARAFRHACGAEGLALIDGQAGTGKSFTTAAIRDTHAAAGYRVIGLAPTNKVARALSEDGFARARTIHSELFALNNARTSWNSKTLVMVDEAAMIDTKLMAMLTAHAAAAGAKLILVGDDRQLSSIDRGGMFGTLKDRYGAAELTEVRRQRKNDDRRASEMLAEGNFDSALGIYERQGAIQWTRTQPEARALLVEQWAKATASDPCKARFVFAYTNEDVNRLNAALRAVRRDRGELGPDQMIETAHGRANFAVGDRIQFTGTDKQAGIVNGEAGTVAAIDGVYLAIKLASPEGRTISFNASAFAKFRHGYAGTIYKGQGDTLDEAYLYHSEHWRRAPSYVALTRHREKTELFVARNTARDLSELARQMARPDERRAASMFHHNGQIEPAKILSPVELLAAIAPEFAPAASAAAERQPIELEAVTPHGVSRQDLPTANAGQPAGGIIGAFTRMTKIIAGLLARGDGLEEERNRDAASKENIQAAAASASAEVSSRGGGEAKDPYLAALLAVHDAELIQDEQEPERPIRRRASRRSRSL